MLFQLGPFACYELIGRGATAEVFRGEHVALSVPVAVKVLTAERTNDPVWTRAFATELQAVARLEHPGIARLYDFGSVDAAGAAAGHVREGAPYLVMEYATGGSLARAARPLPWPELRDLLVRLLDALAHAHARGVVHKDVKPGNVLMCTSRDLHPGPRLADFGVAWASDAMERSDLYEASIAGSPNYMAPEQFAGAWRDYGPWTDLYALGITAWELASGRLPYREATVAGLARQHQLGRLPDLDVVPGSVPRGFESWLRSMLAVETAERFRRAADAAFALVALGDAPAPLPSQPQQSEPELPALYHTLAGIGWQPGRATLSPDDGVGTIGTDAATWLSPPPAVASDTVTADRRPAARGESGRPMTAPSAPPLPTTWRRPHVELTSRRALGAGLSLVGLRRVPFVGRSDERDAVWRELVAVHHDRQPRVVIIRGPSGTGKSRLARWVARRAHEVGGASVLEARHAEAPGASSGLERLLSSQLGCIGLDREGVQRRLASLQRQGRVHDDVEASLLADIVAPRADADVFRDANERFATVYRRLRAEMAERPAVVWIDDAQWGADTVAGLAWVLDRAAREPVPALFVLTVRDEALAERPEEASRLDLLAQRPDARAIALGPLPAAEQVRLVEGMLGVDRALAVRIAERTAGHPLFAVHLVSDWVQRGVLVPSPTGFVLEGPEPSLPDDVHAMWSARLDAALHGEHPHQLRALEVAAALGQEVALRELRLACTLAEVPLDDAAIERWLASRMLERTAIGLAFQHAMLRESLERRARTAGRWIAHNAACARAIADLTTAGTAGVEARIGRHLLEAGRSVEAFAQLLIAADQAERNSDYLGARALLSRASAALDAASRPADHRDRARLAVRSAALLSRQREFDRAFDEASLALEHATRAGWLDVAAAAHEQLGGIARQRGAFSDAADHARAAREAWRAVGDDAGVARSLRLLGQVCILRGQSAEAGRLVGDAMTLFEALSDRLGVAWCLRSLGDIARLENRWADADVAFEKARRAFAAAGHTSGVSECVHGRAEVLRSMGRLDEAAEEYRRSIDLDRSVGAHAPVIATLNLGLLELARDRFTAARDVLETARRAFVDAEQPGYAAVAHACLMPAVVGAGDLDAFDAHLEAAVAGIRAARFVDPDIVDVARRAGDLLDARNETNRASAVRELAIEQLEALGRHDEAAALRRHGVSSRT